ncbi:MAG: DUF4421 domain-containing protein [Cytophagales bacterium]|nr:MAG: DUF4421 domain-containing protein [Cytophagales bacterium]TAF60744.1 MAG: DUF4421 domain-containing protein [Cytophagales bacterium]
MLALILNQLYSSILWIIEKRSMSSVWFRLLVWFGAWGLFQPLYAQSSKKDSLPKPARIVDFERRMAVTGLAAFRNISMQLVLTPQQSTNKDSLYRLEYQPNARQQLGLGFLYKNMAISAALLKVGDPNRRQEVFGKTRYTDLNVQALGRNFVLEGFYKHFRGFAEMPKQNIPIPKPLLRPDLALEYVKLKGLLVLSPHKFSYRAAVNCNQLHTRSGGSWVNVAHLYRFRITSDSTFVPQRVQEMLGINIPDNGANAIGMGFGVGRAQILVYKHFYLAGVLAFGLDGQVKNNTGFKVAPMLDLRLAMGYNGSRIFVVMAAINDYTFLNGSQYKNQVEYRNFSIDFGYRLFTRPQKRSKQLAN